MLKQITLFLGLGVFIITPADASGGLASALGSGKVCERPDGYVQATPGNEGEMSDLVTDVNAKRASVYADIAEKASAAEGKTVDPAAVALERAREEQRVNSAKFCK